MTGQDFYSTVSHLLHFQQEATHQYSLSLFRLHTARISYHAAASNNVCHLIIRATCYTRLHAVSFLSTSNLL